MAPVVNGLESTFGGQVEMRALDAASGQGSSVFQDYGLPGHPSPVIPDPQREVLWSAFGPQLTGDLVDTVEETISKVSTGLWMGAITHNQYAAPSLSFGRVDCYGVSVSAAARCTRPMNSKTSGSSNSSTKLSQGRRSASVRSPVQ